MLAHSSSSAQSMSCMEMITDNAYFRSQYFEGDFTVMLLEQVRYIVKEDATRIRRLLWLLLVTGGLVLLVYQVVDRCLYFRSRPTTTSTRMTHTPGLMFPTITLCNENRISRSKAESKGKIIIFMNLNIFT